MSGRSSAVERHLAKVDVESSILFARSNLSPIKSTPYGNRG